MKKVVVFFPFGDENGTLGQKIFTTKKVGLAADNTEEGALVIREEYGPVIAVFKEWLYWEDVTSK